MRCFVEGIGLLGPGLPGWQASRAVLSGAQPYVEGETILPRLDILPPAERRRTGLPVKLAIAAGLAALAHGEHDAQQAATVFTSSGGDGETIHDICDTLASCAREVSPTRFHNSVHNAPSGYWSIATRAHTPSTSLCAYDWSFPAGLVEAASQVTSQSASGPEALLLISYDMPYPQPFHGVRPLRGVVGIGLLLTRESSTKTLASLDLQVAQRDAPPTLMQDPALEDLRSGNPTARGLPLLAALAGKQPATLTLDYMAGNIVRATVVPQA